MNFKYKKFPYDPDNIPFTGTKSALRPVIEIEFSEENGKFRYLVLVDSGADYCIFHADIGEQLGLDITSGKPLTFYGTSGQPQKAYFHQVKFNVGGHEHKCDVGFSYDMKQLAYGILGQIGFFDTWNIKFEYGKENIEIKPNS